MDPLSAAASPRQPAPRWGDLPDVVDVLVITGPNRLGGLLAQAFATDSAVQVRLTAAEGLADGLARLRERVFDVVLVGHAEEELDAPAVLDVIRAASSDIQPVVVLGLLDDPELAARCFEAGADACLDTRTTTTRTLLWQIARARERHLLLLENQRLQVAQHQRQSWEQDEVTRWFDQQRELLTPENTPLTAGESVPEACAALPASLAADYDKLLRAYVVMGAGQLSAALDHWSLRVARSPISGRQILALHLQSVERVLAGLGSRSARHVLQRADLLIIEVLAQVADHARSSPDRNAEI